MHAFGKLPNYHTLLKVQCEKTKAAIGPKVPLDNVIGGIKQPNDTPWGIKVLRQLVNSNGCIIEVITGKYNRAHCQFNHKVRVKDATAETLAGIVKERTKVISNQA